MHHGNLWTEDKYLVFLSQLLLLFNICPSCKADNSLVETTETSTMVTVHTHCDDPECKSLGGIVNQTWKEQR